MQGGWIGVDLDGTLALYSAAHNWEKGPTHIGTPIPVMVERVKYWLAVGYTVKIMTARVSRGHAPQQIAKVRAAIQKWCVEHIGQVLEITIEKDPNMIVLYDDRAVCVAHNGGSLWASAFARQLVPTSAPKE